MPDVVITSKELDARIDAIARRPFRAKLGLLTQDERGYVVDVICRWAERELGDQARRPPA